jgi:hypothetical protein
MSQGSFIRGILVGVSCVGPSRCVAVGQYYLPGPRYALVERWNGSRWAVEQSPAPPARAHAYLNDVSCAGAADCTAVGSSARTTPQPTTLPPPPTRTLIEHWNGSAWSIVNSPNPPVGFNTLSAVSCTSRSDCMAVGASGDSQQLHVRTLAQRWNGAHWIIINSSNPVGAGYSFLSSISCTSASDCMAVGEYFPGGQGQSQNHILIEHWNGSAWALMPSPKPPGSIASYLSAVSCTGRSDCMAVGTASYPHRQGDSYGGAREHTLIERWNGARWVIVTSPNPAGPPADGLAGVACPTASDCMAVGAGGRLTPPGSADGASTLAERWNGSGWAIVKSPGPSASSSLTQVACASAADCMAVGGFGNLESPASPHPLIEHWNGSAWSLMTSHAAAR